MSNRLNTSMVKHPLGLYAEDGNVWAQMLLNGLTASRCLICNAKRMLLAANILDILASNRNASADVLIQPGLVLTVREIGLDHEWLIQEVGKTKHVHPMARLTERVQDEIREFFADRA